MMSIAAETACVTLQEPIQVHVMDGPAVADACERIHAPVDHPARDLRWLIILHEALGQYPYLLEAKRDQQTVGWLPLVLVRSRVFGRFLVSLPYVNTAGVLSNDRQATTALLDRAVELADAERCKYLELRHESGVEHPALNAEMTSKVHMRLRLPEDGEALWSGLKASVRNQIRKGQRHGFSVAWGAEELLDGFYSVFCRRMHELGTPVFGRPLFERILHHFAGQAEICCVRDAGRPIAAALLIHGDDTTDVPSAASLVSYNPTNANMLMYWHLLVRSVERGQQTFDFGRSTRDGGTFHFKKQWGAQPVPAVWQYYLRQGSVDALRPENTRNQRLIRMWRMLPLWVTRRVGPWVVRGIP